MPAPPTSTWLHLNQTFSMWSVLGVVFLRFGQKAKEIHVMSLFSYEASCSENSNAGIVQSIDKLSKNMFLKCELYKNDCFFF